MEYYIWMEKEKIPVSEPVYKAYCKGIRKEKYFTESDIHNRTFFYDALDSDRLNGSDLFVDERLEPVEVMAEKHWNMEALKIALGELDEEERNLILRLYVYEESLRSIAREEGVAVTTLQYRHKKLLDKLKKQLKKRGVSA